MPKPISVRATAIVATGPRQTFDFVVHNVMDFILVMN